MVFCGYDFVVCIYLIFGEGSLQLIEVHNTHTCKSSKIDVTNSRPETFFNQMGVVSSKMGVVKPIICYVCFPLFPKLPHPCPLPPRKKSCMKLCSMSSIIVLLQTNLLVSATPWHLYFYFIDNSSCRVTLLVQVE